MRERGLSPDFHLRRFEASSRPGGGRIAAWVGEAGSPVGWLGPTLRQRAAPGDEGSRIEYRAPRRRVMLIATTEASACGADQQSAKLRALGELARGGPRLHNLLGPSWDGAVLRRGPRARGRPRASGIEKAALDGRETVRRIQEFSRTPATAASRPWTGRILRDARRSRARAGSPIRGLDFTIEVEPETPALPPVLGNPPTADGSHLC